MLNFLWLFGKKREHNASEITVIKIQATQEKYQIIPTSPSQLKKMIKKVFLKQATGIKLEKQGDAGVNYIITLNCHNIDNAITLRNEIEELFSHNGWKVALSLVTFPENWVKIQMIAAEQGKVEAQYNLGRMYYFGHGVPQDCYKIAVKWFTKAAEQEHAEAQYNLGYMYANSHGVPQDYKEAVKWYTKAAEQGHASAQLNLGLMYELGQGVPGSLKEAIKLYTKFAEQGNVGAQRYLGFKYQEKRLKDNAQAYKWLYLAALQGCDFSRVGFSLLRNQMSDGEFAEAKRLIQKFGPRKKKAADDCMSINKTTSIENPQATSMAWVSLIMGVASILLSWMCIGHILGVCAIIISVIGLSSETPKNQMSKICLKTGMVCGIITIALVIVLVMIA